jgi:RNA polymerase sigma factor (sigma-70 family)
VTSIYQRAKAGCHKAQNELIKQNIPVIRYVLRKWYYNKCTVHCAWEDAEAIGYQAVLKAVQTFDESRNVKFSTYVKYYIRAYVQHMFSALRKVFNVPDVVKPQGGYTKLTYASLETHTINDRPIGELVPSDTSDPVDGMIQKRQYVKAVEVIEKLSVKDPRLSVIALRRWIHGDPVVEIAASFGVSRQMVEKLERKLRVDVQAALASA